MTDISAIGPIRVKANVRKCMYTRQREQIAALTRSFAHFDWYTQCTLSFPPPSWLCMDVIGKELGCCFQACIIYANGYNFVHGRNNGMTYSSTAGHIVHKLVRS